MYRSIFITLFVLTSFACQYQRAQISENTVKNDVPSMSNSLNNSENKPSDENTNELVETFTDDKNIGVKGKNKIEISEFRTSENNRVEIKFYSLGKDNGWKLKQNIEQEKFGGGSCDMKVKDFNNDEFKDVTFISGTAARGANEIRNLFIYDRTKDELVFIKNSGDFPNLSYNETLNCIDSWAVTGSSWTSFLKIDGDVLKEFARVATSNTDNSRYAYLIDKDGKEKLLRKDKISEDEIYERYKTFNPPTINTDEESQ